MGVLNLMSLLNLLRNKVEIDGCPQLDNLVALNLQMLFRHRSNLRAMVVMSLVVFVYLAISRSLDSPYNWGVAVFSSVVAGIGGILIGNVVGAIFILFNSNHKNGVLGVHSYEITEDGLLEVTDVNEGLNRWVGIESVIRSRDYLYIQISSYLFHVISRRSFSSDEQFEDFFSEAVRCWKSAA